MTRYYNENPQVRHWMEKCAMLQQALDITNEIISQNMRIENHYKDMCRLMRERMNSFNKLPWYKKMFYKFEI